MSLLALWLLLHISPLYPAVVYPFPHNCVPYVKARLGVEEHAHLVVLRARMVATQRNRDVWPPLAVVHWYTSSAGPLSRLLEELGIHHCLRVRLCGQKAVPTLSRCLSVPFPKQSSVIRHYGQIEVNVLGEVLGVLIPATPLSSGLREKTKRSVITDASVPLCSSGLMDRAMRR